MSNGFMVGLMTGVPVGVFVYFMVFDKTFDRCERCETDAKYTRNYIGLYLLAVAALLVTTGVAIHFAKSDNWLALAAGVAVAALASAFATYLSQLHDARDTCRACARNGGTPPR